MFDIKITSTPLNPDDANSFVTNELCGGIVTFTGTARKFTKGKEVLRLEFEAYEPMAIKEMTKIAKQILEDFPAEKVAIHHRIGVVGLKEIAVVIAVACPHRKAAFAACQYAIDTLKETVPIWKKEIFEDGEIWVAAHP
ncbi:MAG: molybdenum cofactor biosynthesis protein MoaE [Saprospiraceae bacterium]|jgi:molybdopterin synthase catalytic subunit